jgi:hypothetical protein
VLKVLIRLKSIGGDPERQVAVAVAERRQALAGAVQRWCPPRLPELR